MLKKLINNHKVLLIHLAVIGLFSLIPFLWLKEGQAILGHDAGFPLSPWVHFLDRIFVWTHRFGLGNDQTTEVGGFFIHGFEGVIDLLGFSLTNVQRITFSAYFLGFGLSMYFLAREMFEKKQNYLPLFAAVFYMVNHFLLQAWFIVERTKFTLYIALPIVLMLILKLSKGKLSVFQASVLSALVIFFLNGGGFFPLFGAFLVTIPYFITLLILQSDRKIATLKEMVVYCFLWTFFTLAFNAYWVIPYVRFTITSFADELNTAGGTSGVLAWVKTISANTSFYNMFRLQGIQEWYVNKLHPYAQTMLENAFVYTASYLWPVIAYSSFLFTKTTKEKKSITALIGLSLIGMLFMAGSHPPFGFIYLWLIENIPGFVIFRTPYYKFAPTLFLAFSLLMAFALDSIIQHPKVKRFSPLFACLIMVGWSSFHFPFFSGNFFEYEVGQKTTKVTVPDYVFDYADWANSDEFPYQRLLLLPGQNANTHFEAYTWDYWSLAQIQGLLNNRSYIGNSLYKSVSEEIFIKNLYELVERKDPTWVDQAQYLFVDAVLLRKDFDYQLENSTTSSPEEIQAFLENDTRFTKVKEFGEWVIYELESEPRSFALKNYFYEVHTQDKEKFFEPTTLPNLELDPETVFVEENVQNFEDRKKGEIYLPECIHCLLDENQVYEVSRNQIITSGSIFYSLSQKADQELIDNAQSSSDKLHVSSQIVTKRLFQLQSQFAQMAIIEERILGWQELVAALNQQQLFLNEYLAEHPSLTYQQNKFLSIIYENVSEQLEEIEFNMQDVNQEDEAALFSETIDYLYNFKTQIAEQLWYSETSTTKKFLFEVNNAGEYDLFVKANTFHALDENSAPIELNHNNLTTQINPNQITYNPGDAWARIAAISLEPGINRLSLEDTPDRTYFGSDGTIELSFDDDQRCHSFELGYLSRSRYQFNMEAVSDREVDDLYVFINKKGTETTLLPYWGKKMEISQNQTKYLEFPHLNNDPGEYEIRYCRISTSEISDRSVTIENAYFETLTETLVTLVKENRTEVVDNSLSLESSENNQTDYTVTINGSGKSLLMFDQRFDPGWQFTNSDQTLSNHQRIHGFANGWLLQKNNQDQLHFNLKYVGQKLYRWGWLVSIISLSLALISLVAVWLKKKAVK